MGVRARVYGFMHAGFVDMWCKWNGMCDARVSIRMHVCAVSLVERESSQTCPKHIPNRCFGTWYGRSLGRPRHFGIFLGLFWEIGFGNAEQTE
jgi:hypothetical protein